MNCNLLVLGASGDRHFTGVPLLKSHVTVIALDGRSAHLEEKSADNYVPISAFLAKESKSTVFTERKFTDCSSVLAPNKELVELFGLQEHYTVVSEMRVAALGPADFAAVLRGKQLNINAIKSDLEGLDLIFCGELLRSFPSVDVVQLELRANPFYQAEPSLGDALMAMKHQGFTAISIKSEHWKSPSLSKISKQGGLVAHSDVVFLREEIFKNSKTYPPLRLRNAVLSLLFLRQYVSAEILLNQNKQKFERNLYRRILISLLLVRVYNVFLTILHPLRLLKRFIRPSKYMRHVLKG